MKYRFKTGLLNANTGINPYESGICNDGRPNNASSGFYADHSIITSIKSLMLL